MLVGAKTSHYGPYELGNILLYSAFISMQFVISQPRISYINHESFIQLFFLKVWSIVSSNPNKLIKTNKVTARSIISTARNPQLRGQLFAYAIKILINLFN